MKNKFFLFGILLHGIIFNYYRYYRFRYDNRENQRVNTDKADEEKQKTRNDTVK